MSVIRAPAANQHVVATRRGGPETLELAEAPLPPLQPGHVRVRVLAAGVLLGDVFWQRGMLPGSPTPPFTPGYDVVGVVDRVATGGATPFGVGDRVAAITGFGGYSRYLDVPEANLAPVADDIRPAELSALVMSYLTAYQILHHVARLERGARVLIHGAAGSTGSAFLDLARAMELETWGTASPGKREIVASYGATPIDYRNEDFVERMAREAPGGVDLVVDPIGGAHLDRSWRTLGRGGTLVATAAMGALRGTSIFSVLRGFAAMWMRDKLPNGRSALLFNVVEFNEAHPERFAPDLEVLASLLRDGRIAPRIAAELPLEEAADAQRLLVESRAAGRVVLRPDIRPDARDVAMPEAA